MIGMAELASGAAKASCILAIALASVSHVEAKNLRWTCTYTQEASPKGLAKEPLNLEFAYDDVTGKAVMIGNQSMSDVEVHGGPQGISFMEKLGSGAVQTTTVTYDGASVHSRHSVFVEMIPSQYYGHCDVR